MIVLGLTGSIGMGKSHAVTVLRRFGLPVHDADAAVHGLLARGGGAVEAVRAGFPGVVESGAVNRRKLGDQVFADRAALARLEAILHPMARRSARRFLQRQMRARRHMAVLDIPLLYETGGDALCDAVILMSAPRRIQTARVLARRGMTAAKFAAIRAQQLPDGDKRKRADFVVPTGLSKRETLRRLLRIATVMGARPGGAWPPRGRVSHSATGRRHADRRHHA